MVQCKFPRTDKILTQSYRMHIVLRRIQRTLILRIKSYEHHERVVNWFASQGKDVPGRHRYPMTGHELIESLFMSFNDLLKEYNVDLD